MSDATIDRPLSSSEAVFSPSAAPAPLKWEPLYDKVLVRRHKPKEFHDADGKLQVPETSQQAQNVGTVVAVGGGRLNLQYGNTIPLTVAIGMEVLFGKHAGTDMEDEPDLVMLREDELLAYRFATREE